jgi:hypothetical protein
VSIAGPPAIEDRLEPVVIIGHADYEVLLDPDQQVMELEAEASKA